MFHKNSVLISCASIALAVGAGVPAVRAQAPTETTPAFTVQPTQMPLPFPGMAEPFFQAADGNLSLEELKGVDNGGVVVIPINPPPAQTALWSQPLDNAPANFTFEADDYDETLADADHHVVWSEHFEKPSFSLILAPDGTAVLTDENAKRLWSGYLPSSPEAFEKQKDEKPPLGMGVSQGSVGSIQYRFLYGSNLVTLEDVYGNTLWSGKPEQNDGLEVSDGSSRGVSGVPIVPFSIPRHVPLQLQVTTEAVSLTVSDALHHPIAVMPEQIATITPTSHDPRYQDKMAAFRAGLTMLGQTVAAYPKVKFSGRPGTYYFTYLDKHNAFLHGELYTINPVSPDKVVYDAKPEVLESIARQDTIYQVLETDVDERGLDQSEPRQVDCIWVPKATALPGQTSSHAPAELHMAPLP